MTTLTFIILTLSASISLAQIPRKTPLKIDSTKVIEFKGTSSTGAEAIDALAVYSPSNSIGQSQQAKSECQFDEDRFFPDGPDQNVLIKAKGEALNYSLKIPLSGIRKNCRYSLTTILFTINKKPIYEMIQIHTHNQTQVDDTTPAPFPLVSKISCEFGSEMTGICNLNDQMLDFSYRIEPVPQVVTVDITQSETTSY